MAPMSDLSRAAWRTSSYSNNGGECIEVASAGALVCVCDTKNRGYGAPRFRGSVAALLGVYRHV